MWLKEANMEAYPLFVPGSKGLYCKEVNGVWVKITKEEYNNPRESCDVGLREQRS